MQQAATFIVSPNEYFFSFLFFSFLFFSFLFFSFRFLFFSFRFLFFSFSFLFILSFHLIFSLSYRFLLLFIITLYFSVDRLWNSTSGRYVLENGLTSVATGVANLVDLYEDKGRNDVYILQTITITLLPLSFCLVLLILWFLVRSAIREIQNERVAILKLFLAIPKDNILSIVSSFKVTYTVFYCNFIVYFIVILLFYFIVILLFYFIVYFIVLFYCIFYCICYCIFYCIFYCNFIVLFYCFILL
jgi:hypothetical protein